MKTLPTLREKKRYIVFRVHKKESLPFSEVKHAIFDSLLEFLGERGLAQARARLIKNLWNGTEGFLETGPKSVDSVKVALSLIHQIGDQPVSFETLKVTGTIASGKKVLGKGA